MDTKLVLLLLLLASPLHAEGPLYRHKDGKVDQEFENVYQDIQGRQEGFALRTKAQLLANTPSRTNQFFICTDCTTDLLVVSTATTPGGVARATARTTVIN